MKIITISIIVLLSCNLIAQDNILDNLDKGNYEVGESYYFAKYPAKHVVGNFRYGEKNECMCTDYIRININPELINLLGFEEARKLFIEKIELLQRQASEEI